MVSHGDSHWVSDGDGHRVSYGVNLGSVVGSVMGLIMKLVIWSVMGSVMRSVTWSVICQSRGFDHEVNGEVSHVVGRGVRHGVGLRSVIRSISPSHEVSEVPKVTLCIEIGETNFLDVGVGDTSHHCILIS